jgi:glycerol uptake facilitator-like aquaporin
VVTYAFTLTGQQPFFRSISYLALYIFAVHVSGAHFNPATTLAVYLTEKGDQKRKNNYRYLLSAILI